MKIIFTYCNTENRATKPSEFLHNLARLSAGSIKKFTDYKTELYIDPKQYKWFKDIEYFDNIVKVDYFEDNFDPRYWNYPKLKTYALQTEPFLHMDLDMVIVPGFTVPENSDIITEKVRDITDETGCFRHAYPDAPIPKQIICSGMIGCTNAKGLQVFAHQYKKAKMECVKGMYEEVSFQDLYSIEEVAFTQMVVYNQMTVSQIMLSKFIHFQGQNKEAVFGDEVKRLLTNFRL